jgi:hypothetical protein
MAASWSIVEYRGRDALKQLEADWRRLYAAMSFRTGFQAYEAHVAYFDLLMAAPERFRCLALRDGQSVRAICPLEARVEGVLGPSIPVWGVPLHPHMMVSDVICPEDDARRQLLPALLDYLRHRPEGRPLLVLGPLPADSVLWEGLRRLPSGYSCTNATGAADVFDCERSFDELSSRFTANFRSKLRRQSRRLSTLDDVGFVNVMEAADLPCELEALLQVEASGWKGESGTGSAIKLHPKLVAYYRTLTSTLGTRGAEDRCEINSLYADGRCIASQFCMRTGGEYVMPKIAYDEEYSRLTPGLLLFEQTLERCCKDNEIRRLNFLTSPAWMNVWHPDQLAMQQAHLAIGHWCGRPLIAMLRFRFGRGREMVHWLRRRVKRGTDEGANRHAAG